MNNGSFFSIRKVYQNYLWLCYFSKIYKDFTKKIEYIIMNFFVFSYLQFGPPETLFKHVHKNQVWLDLIRSKSRSNFFQTSVNPLNFYKKLMNWFLIKMSVSFRGSTSNFTAFFIKFYKSLWGLAKMCTVFLSREWSNFEEEFVLTLL